MSRTILVIGATGSQGSSVVRHLINNGTFIVRCLVRSSDKAASLIDAGCQVVKGDLNDVNSLVRAMIGCYGVFAVTNFWDPSVGYDGEIQQGKNIGEACVTTGIKHLVFSTLDRNSSTKHFESKVIAEDYIRSLGVPMTCIITSFYFENFLNFFPPKVVDGTVTFTVAQLESTDVPMFSVYSTGGWVVEAFRHPKQYIGHDIAAVGEYISYPNLVATFSRVTGRPAKFESLPNSVFRSFGFPGADELADNLQFFDDISSGVKEDRRKGSDVVPCDYVGETFEEFLLRTKWIG